MTDGPVHGVVMIPVMLPILMTSPERRAAMLGTMVRVVRMMEYTLASNALWVLSTVASRIGTMRCENMSNIIKNACHMAQLERTDAWDAP